MEDDQGDPLTMLVVKEYGKLTRGSYGTKEALQKARQANENSLDASILKYGDTAWLAFYAARKAAGLKHGFDGQARLSRLLHDLDASAVETQRDFASQLATAMRIDDEQVVESNTLLEESNGVYDERNSAKRRRTGNTSSTAVTNTVMQLTCADHYATEQASGITAQLRIGAPLGAAQELFHNQFWDSIERIRSREDPNIWLANITIFSQDGGLRDHFGYQMQIGIVPEKVAEYALEYFGVKVEIKDGTRYVRYPGRGIIEGDSAVILRESIRDYSRIFKGELYEAHRISPVYQSEEKKRLSHTNSVSLRVSNQAKEGGKMTVYLGEWRALVIQEKFYG